MRDLNALKAFRDVAKAGGFAAAHRLTGQSRATLSRHIAALEDDIGIHLIERSTRSFRLTGQGQLLLERTLEIFAQLDDAVAEMEDRQHRPQGLVRVALPPSLLRLDIGRKILSFLQEKNDVRIQIEASNREVDIRHEGVDFVIRARTTLDYPLDFVPVPLARMEMAIVAHPSFRLDALRPMRDLVHQIPVLAWSGIDGESRWQLKDGDRAVDITFTPRLIVDDIVALRDAALCGLGMAMMPRTFVHDDISIGRLFEIESDLKAPDRVLHALHLGQHRMRPAVRQLLDWLKVAARHLK